MHFLRSFVYKEVTSVNKRKKTQVLKRVEHPKVSLVYLLQTNSCYLLTNIYSNSLELNWLLCCFCGLSTETLNTDCLFSTESMDFFHKNFIGCNIFSWNYYLILRKEVTWNKFMNVVSISFFDRCSFAFLILLFRLFSL
jgi:hypothetical protein